MLDDVDLLVCGAGPAGCVVAERAATTLGWKVLVVDKRAHIAGNCHDSQHPSGVLVHNYGPHYFRTNDDSLLRHLSQFTDWIPANYEVRSSVHGKLYSFPINITTLEEYYGRTLTPESARRLLSEKRLAIQQPSNSKEWVLSRIGTNCMRTFIATTRSSSGASTRGNSIRKCAVAFR